jgi:hypothetical protein
VLSSLLNNDLAQKDGIAFGFFLVLFFGWHAELAARLLVTIKLCSERDE